MKAPLDVNLDRLTQFVEGLQALPPTVVNMSSGTKPTCGSPGCHAGLVCLVSGIVPELWELYKIGCSGGCENETGYYYRMWGAALGAFLLSADPSDGYASKLELMELAEAHPEWWGNQDGWGMFSCPSAFGQTHDGPFSHRVIVDHWSEVLERTKELHREAADVE